MSKKGRKCPWVADSNRRRVTHGKSRSATYQVWGDMRQRCLNNNNCRFKDYGGRGITICDRWNDFSNFLNDMGEKPAGLSLGRINNFGNYEPANCRWETREQQQRNRRGNKIINWAGISMTAVEWADKLKININCFRGRIRKWTIQKAMTHEYRPRTLLY